MAGSVELRGINSLEFGNFFARKSNFSRDLIHSPQRDARGSVALSQSEGVGNFLRRLLRLLIVIHAAHERYPNFLTRHPVQQKHSPLLWFE